MYITFVQSVTENRGGHIKNLKQLTNLTMESHSALSISSNSDSDYSLTVPPIDEGDDYAPTPKKKKGNVTSAKKSTPKSSMAGASTSALQPKSEIPGLRALSVNQLIDLIETFIETHSEFKNEVVRLIPLPDLGPLENRLQALKQNIDKSFPWCKYGTGRNSFCFNRVKTHLDTFQSECIQQCKTLIDLKEWKSSIEYIIVAWKYVGELPTWDEPKHNKHKPQCYKKLSLHLVNALKKGTFKKQELQGFIARFKKYKDNEMVDCIKLAETILSKLK